MHLNWPKHPDQWNRASVGVGVHGITACAVLALGGLPDISLAQRTP